MGAVCAGDRSSAPVLGHHHPAADQMTGLQQQSETLEVETRNEKTKEHTALFLSAESKGS